nr:reverse transcriptase domain-containing protein [Tanacetum cinerariifolium]
MSGNEDHHRQGRRFAAGGNGHDGRDPRDVKIERLRQRVRDLEIQHEIRQIRKRIRELELQRDDVNEEEVYPSFDSYPQSFEPIYPDIFSEDEPRFDEEEVVNSDYEESSVFDDDQYEAETENIFGGTGLIPGETTREVKLFRRVMVTLINGSRVDVPFDPGDFAPKAKLE